MGGKVNGRKRRIDDDSARDQDGDDDTLPFFLSFFPGCLAFVFGSEVLGRGKKSSGEAKDLRMRLESPQDEA